MKDQLNLADLWHVYGDCLDYSNNGKTPPTVGGTVLCIIKEKVRCCKHISILCFYCGCDYYFKSLSP